MARVCWESPANQRHSRNAGPMLGKRHIQWSNIKLVFHRYFVSGKEVLPRLTTLLNQGVILPIVMRISIKGHVRIEFFRLSGYVVMGY